MKTNILTSDKIYIGVLVVAIIAVIALIVYGGVSATSSFTPSQTLNPVTWWKKYQTNKSKV